MLFKMLKINFHKMKQSYLLLFLTLLFCVAALVVTLLMVRSRKMQEADEVLQAYGNYDLAFCEVTQELEGRLVKDGRFSELGYVYDLGQLSFQESGNLVECGALRDKSTESMYYVNPAMGRYPSGKGEICVDRITLKCNGYSEKLGQKIPVSYVDDSGRKWEKKFELVGIIEVQKHDPEDGVTYSTRTYPEEMYSVTNDRKINFPFAYISMDEAEELFSCDKKHILTNVSPKENTADIFREYIGEKDGQIDRSAVKHMHIDTDHFFGREWAAQCILGKQLESGETSDIVRESMESGNVQEDAYTKYFIPIFMGLIVIISSAGIFDAVRLSMEERRELYGILLSMGMTGIRIMKYMFLEFLLLLLSAVLLGWGAGALGYMGILAVLHKLLYVTLPSALAPDPYFEPYIKLVTRDPWAWSVIIACIVTVVGLCSVSVDLLSMTPVRLGNSAIRKRQRKKHAGSIYHILNRYMGRDSRSQRWIPYFMVVVLMSVSLFGFLFFREKSIRDTDLMAERIESTRIKGMDYYMKATGAIFSGTDQYMHQSGVTEQMYRALEKNDAVETIKGIVGNHSTAVICDKKDMLSAALQEQSEYPASSDTDEHLKYFQFMGVDTEKQGVFHVPTVGVRDEDLDCFRDSVTEGEIHSEKLQSGEEVLVVVRDESLASCFTLGETLPLYDVVRPEELDNSVELLIGDLPEGYRSEEHAYSVTVNGMTRKMYCYESLQKCNTRIGAVICMDEEDSFFFDDNGGNCQVNVITGMGAYQKWGLPNRNYTSVGVKIKSGHDTRVFEREWMRILQEAGYMESIDVYSIIQEKDRRMAQIMAIFYATFAVLLLIGTLCCGNSIAMRIQHMEEEQKILYQLGLGKGRLLWLYIRRYAFMGLVGTVFSAVPVTLYSLLVKYALARNAEAFENDTVEMLYAQHPWMESLPMYNMLNAGFAAALAVCGILAVILLSALVLMQSGRMNRVLGIQEKED